MQYNHIVSHIYHDYASFSWSMHHFILVDLLIFSSCSQVERLPILIDSPKKLDHQLSSDPDKTPVSNAANSDSEPEDMNQPGETKTFRQVQQHGFVSLCRTVLELKKLRMHRSRFCPEACKKSCTVW